MVEGVLLRSAHGRLQRLGQPRNGRLHHVHRSGHPIVHRRAPGHDQPLKGALKDAKTWSRDPADPSSSNAVKDECDHELYLERDRTGARSTYPRIATSIPSRDMTLPVTITCAPCC